MNIKIEVWEKGNPFNSAEKYFNDEYPNDYNKEVAKLLEQINNKQNGNTKRHQDTKEFTVR